MVTVSQRPTGIKIIDQLVSAVITDNSGDALVTLSAHSLITGNYIFLESDIDAYNGMWYVEVINGSTFKLRENDTADFVEYYQDADIQYYQTNTHVWSSIFLPIIYKATNDRYPVNTDDSVVGVVSQADDNGYTELTLSGVTGANPLEYVILNDGNVYQVIELNPPLLTISKAYDATSAITTVQKHYNNYQIKVKIFAGLPSSEPWASRKPWQEVGELSLTPDENNNVMFSVSDYIKALVTVRNNPLLFSMPLNLDAFTGFYISTAESYDTSDGYSLATEESSFTDDSFQGYAITGVLPFKNRYSGHFSDYIYISGNPAQWLNTLTRVIGVVDRYFDVSFIKNISGAFTLIIEKWANDYLYEVELVEYEDFGIGVYRLPLEFSSAYDQYCIRAQKPEISAIPPQIIPVGFMVNCPGASWVEGGNPFVDVPGGINDSGYITEAFASQPGVPYEFTYYLEIIAGTGSPLLTVRIAFLDDDCNVVGYAQDTYASIGVKTATVTITGSSIGTKIGVNIRNIAFIYSRTVELQGLTFAGVSAIPAADITQELCIDIYEVCTVDGGTSIEPTGARRLLEDGGFRLLEE